MIIKATKYGHQKGTDEVFLFTNNINAILVQRGESCILLGRYRMAFWWLNMMGKIQLMKYTTIAKLWHGMVAEEV